MDTISDPELLSFASQVVETSGGVTESSDNSLRVLLPPNLTRLLELPEEVWLGKVGVPLLYGSQVLDRLIQVPTQDVPVVPARIRIPYLKRAGFELLVRKQVIFSGGTVRISSRAETLTMYMILTCRYVALSDERKEGLIQVGMHESTGAIIDDLQNLWKEANPEFYNQQSKVPQHFRNTPAEQSINVAMQTVRTLAESELSEFLSSMQRRLRRDIKNTREYYIALKREMEAGLARANINETQRRERGEKIREISGEVDRKILDLREKYKVHLRLTGCAAWRILMDVVQLLVEIRFRNSTRIIPLTWNPITQQLDPFVCECCYESIRKVFLIEENKQLGLLCFQCTRR